MVQAGIGALPALGAAWYLSGDSGESLGVKGRTVPAAKDEKERTLEERVAAIEEALRERRQTDRQIDRETPPTAAGAGRQKGVQKKRQNDKQNDRDTDTYTHRKEKDRETRQ